MSIADTVTHLRSGALDLLTYLRALCDRIEAEEPQIQALVPETYSRERIMRDAARLLEQYPEPASRPPLFGVPIGVKDIFRAEGFPTRCGSALPPELFEGAEAECVTQLKRAGGIIVGKMVTTEFAWAEPGPTRNPHNLEHTPGGSSSGSAAGVARDFFLFGLGTQTIGSTIRPAAYCGIVGFKPSYGRIAPDGVIPFSPSADTVGILCKDVSGLKHILPVLFQDGWSSEHADARKPALGVPEGAYLDQATPDAREHFEKHLARIADAGYTITRIETLRDIEAINNLHVAMISAELASVHADWFEAYRELYRPKTADTIRAGFVVSSVQLSEARAGRADLRARLEAQMRSEGIGFWICPSATDSAPRGLQSTGSPMMSLPWTYAGLPTISLPAGFDAQGLPLGVQVIAAFGRDEMLVSRAEELARVFEI
jgi:Asp-tRNA(Asn)/Glu-tRNA(Gln) amidotransferase A subunit family amidase